MSPHSITLPPPHLSATRTQQSAYRSPHHRHIQRYDHHCRLNESGTHPWIKLPPIAYVTIAAAFGSIVTDSVPLYTVKILPLNIRLESKSMHGSKPTSHFCRRQTSTTTHCILCAAYVVVRKRSRRNWVKRSWFCDATLALPGRGLSLKNLSMQF